MNPTTPRVWQTSFLFEELARRYALDAGLREIARRRSWCGTEVFNGTAGLVGRALGFPQLCRSGYDRFMLRFHNYLKENPVFQASCAKTKIEFPPLSSWLVFTDGLAHSVISGRYAIEQTVLVSGDALVCPQHSPRRILERLCGRSLV